MRLDKALVVRGLCRSRAEAQAALDDGAVTVDGLVVRKASLTVGVEAALVMTDTGPRWVSRGALKLDAALAHFRIDVAGRAALDVGASTGGFTECLLRRGAASVHAVDVGHGQMVPALSADPRVRSREGVNARSLAPTDFPHPFGIIVADLSFISLSLVLPALTPLLGAGGDLVCLVKPQFEVGLAKVGKGGIVRDAGAREEALARVVTAAHACGLTEQGRMTSPIEGTEGNVEFLLWLKTRAGSSVTGGE
jgi:23S rRNA (cytidine1920-2'-O)/16S rRNA (cytidine1409-2'-O)-methyltransferase